MQEIEPDEFQELIFEVERVSRESERIDFKSEKDFFKSKSGKCEVIKDIVAIANSGGGALVFGCDSCGNSLGEGNHLPDEFDESDLANLIWTYTGIHFSNFRATNVRRGKNMHFSLLIGPVETPLIFIRDGSYQAPNGKEKMAFRKGVVYFRHSSKSEPGTSDDLAKWRDRSLNRIRSNWLDGIRQVVETDGSENVVVVHNKQVRFTNDENAPAVRLTNQSDTHILKSGDIIEDISERVGRDKVFNMHDFKCFLLYKKISSDLRPDLVFKPHPTSSPQYKPELVDIIAENLSSEPDLLKKCRQKYRDNGNSYKF